MAYEIDLVEKIYLGVRGENEARDIEFDVSGWLEKWPDAVFTVLVLRPEDTVPYMSASVLDGSVLRWTITATETAQKGTGLVEVQCVSGTVLAKSLTVKTMVRDCLQGEPSPTPPEPMEDWVDQVIEAASDIEALRDELEDAKDDALSAAATANAAAANVNGALAMETDKKFKFISGCWNDNGAYSVNAARVCSYDLIPIDLFRTITFPEGYTGYALVYDASKAKLGFYGYNGGSYTSQIDRDGVLTSKPAARYIGVNVRRDATPSADISSYLDAVNAGIVYQTLLDYRMDSADALIAKSLQGYAQYNSDSAWQTAFPTNLLADIPVNRVVILGTGSIAASDKPTTAFWGHVLTVSRDTSLRPGCVQYAVSSDRDGMVYLRTYMYASGGNYWTSWTHIAPDEDVYYVGATRDYTSLTTLLLDLKGNERKKVIYVDGGEYDIFAEYQAEISAGRITVPPDDISASSYFEPYNAFVPNNTRLVGLGDVTLKMTPTVAQLDALSGETGQTGYGAAATWSPVNVYGSVEIENVTVVAHNARYCMHNDDHNGYPGARQHYKGCRFRYTFSDTDAQGRRLGFNHAIGFGIQQGALHVYEDCEFSVDTPNQHSAFYGHEGSAYKDGSIVVKNCVIRSTNMADQRTIKLQSLATAQGHVRVRFEGCYINGGLCLEMYNQQSKQNFDVELVGCNRVPVLRVNTAGGSIVDPYAVTWYNALPTPTAQDPRIDVDSYSAT